MFACALVTSEMHDKLLTDRDRDVLVAIHPEGYVAPPYRCRPDPVIPAEVRKSWSEDAHVSQLRATGIM